MTPRRGALVWTLAAGALLLQGCAPESGDRAAIAGGDAKRGELALKDYGCGACHVIPGIAGADGVVGPPLADMRRRAYLARGLPNTPANMMRWIRTPQALAPGSAMPDMQVSVADAQSMTAYLYRAD